MAYGYYHDGNDCSNLGTVNNCEEYNEVANSCARCKDGFLLAILSGDVHRCLEYTSEAELCETATVSE